MKIPWLRFSAQRFAAVPGILPPLPEGRYVLITLGDVAVLIRKPWVDTTRHDRSAA